PGRRLRHERGRRGREEMNTLSRSAVRGVAAVVVLCASAITAHDETATARIVGAANAFLATLDPKQRASVSFAFDDEKQRARWSNLPVQMVPRGGLPMGELGDRQRAAALALLSSALSRRGFEKVQEIVESDEALKKSEGSNPMFGHDLYYISILGTPSETAPWMVQFGGHHLGL